MTFALYRKYRPERFDDVIGQDAAVAVLKGAVEKGAISHAYLFSGTRGTGKTSVARIFGHAVGVAPEDMYEIDAASNRGIDDIRELREAAATLPFSSPYKLYIVDEAHMLTKEAWNALLKILEEPPAHVLFILATTEIEKVPDTILSRCQAIPFATPQPAVIAALIERVAAQEQVRLGAGAAALIARAADGSFRDAHGILQKVLIATGDAEVTEDEIARIIGAPKSDIINSVFSGVVEGVPERAFAAAASAAAEGIKIPLLIELVLERLRGAMLLRLAPSLAAAIRARHSAEDFELLQKFSKAPRANAATLDVFLKAAIDAKRSAMPEVALEIAIASAIEMPAK